MELWTAQNESQILKVSLLYSICELCRKQVCHILSAVLLLFLINNYALAARSVALVYDDSGSMRTNEYWRYANYALQSLTAFLGDDDTLYLVNMSEYEKEYRISGQRDKQNLVERLRKGREPKALSPTPYQAVQTAMKRLIDANQDQEKWLVIITDGEFFERPEFEKHANSIEQEISRFLKATGSRSIVLLIGRSADKSVANLWRRSGQATILKAANSREIVDRLHETAALLTSRDKQSANLNPESRGDTLALSPLFPLQRLTIFAQSKDTNKLPPKINNVSVQGGDGEFDFYHLTMVASSRSKDHSQAMITHVTPRPPSIVIHDGPDQLSLSFDQPLKRFDYRLYPEVAARLDIVLRDATGKVLAMPPNQPIEVCEKASLSLHAKLMTGDNKTLTETQTDIDQFETVYIIDDSTVKPMMLNSAHTEFIAQFKPKLGNSVISVRAAYPGYFDFRSRIYTLNTIDCKPREISIESDTTSWLETLTEIPMGKVSLTASIDGKPITQEDFNDAQMTLISDTDVAFSLYVNEANRQWILQPRFNWGCACFTASGSQRVEVRLTGMRQGEYTQRTIMLNVNDVSWWEKCRALVITATLLIFLIWYFIGLYKKSRFSPGSIITYRRGSRTHTEPLPSPWFSHWFIPYIPEKRYVGSVLFIAGLNSSYIILSKKTQSDKMSISGLPIDDPGQVDVRLSNAETLEILERQLESYTYSSSSLL